MPFSSKYFSLKIRFGLARLFNASTIPKSRTNFSTVPISADSSSWNQEELMCRPSSPQEAVQEMGDSFQVSFWTSPIIFQRMPSGARGFGADPVAISPIVDIAIGRGTSADKLAKKPTWADKVTSTLYKLSESTQVNTNCSYGSNCQRLPGESVDGDLAADVQEKPLNTRCCTCDHTFSYHPRCWQHLLASTASVEQELRLRQLRMMGESRLGIKIGCLKSECWGHLTEIKQDQGISFVRPFILPPVCAPEPKSSMKTARIFYSEVAALSFDNVISGLGHATALPGYGAWASTRMQEQKVEEEHEHRPQAEHATEHERMQGQGQEHEQHQERERKHGQAQEKERKKNQEALQVNNVYRTEYSTFSKRATETNNTGKVLDTAHNMKRTTEPNNKGKVLDMAYQTTQRKFNNLPPNKNSTEGEVKFKWPKPVPADDIPDPIELKSRVHRMLKLAAQQDLRRSALSPAVFGAQMRREAFARRKLQRWLKIQRSVSDRPPGSPCDMSTKEIQACIDTFERSFG